MTTIVHLPLSFRSSLKATSSRKPSLTLPNQEGYPPLGSHSTGIYPAHCQVSMGWNCWFYYLHNGLWGPVGRGSGYLLPVSSAFSLTVVEKHILKTTPPLPCRPPLWQAARQSMVLVSGGSPFISPSTHPVLPSHLPSVSPASYFQAVSSNVSLAKPWRSFLLHPMVFRRHFWGTPVLQKMVPWFKVLGKPCQVTHFSDFHILMLWKLAHLHLIYIKCENVYDLGKKLLNKWCIIELMASCNQGNAVWRVSCRLGK